ncbi:unnamed protein product [Allacma fusca]|uniref:MULE transposase domain-containing protein n=1 Tax=Allacma fusca TaxID=39272 RepID=A0A8J2J4N5_9HEXA|nr:unnamed protein product [Allacma fusca]
MAKVFETSLTISGYLQARKLLDELDFVITFKVVNGEKSLFWRVDGYRWEHLGAERCPRNKPEMMCYKFKLLSYDEDTKVLEKQEFIRKEYVYAKYQTGRLDPEVRIGNVILLILVVPISSQSVVNTGNAFQNEESCELFVLTNEASLNSGRSTAGPQNETLPQYIRTEPSVHSHGFVHLLDLANGLKVVLGISPLLDHVERLYSVNDFIYFYYDTTYAVGDYFVSILSLEHRHFRTNVHKGLFSMLKDRIPSFNTEKTVLVMDREAAITKAIRLVNPDVKVFYCWRHLRETI